MQTYATYTLFCRRGGVAAHLSPAHHVGPPQLLQVVLHLHAQRPVVEEARHRVVDLGGGEDEASLLAQVHKGVHLDSGAGACTDAGAHCAGNLFGKKPAPLR
jgi:hypothetical protein